jgi:hypothetical protein
MNPTFASICFSSSSGVAPEMQPASAAACVCSSGGKIQLRQHATRQLDRHHGGEIETDLAHDLDDLVLHARRGLEAGRDAARFPWIGELIEERARDLRAALVVRADEQDELRGHRCSGTIR